MVLVRKSGQPKRENQNVRRGNQPRVTPIASGASRTGQVSARTARSVSPEVGVAGAAICILGAAREPQHGSRQLKRLQRTVVVDEARKQVRAASSGSHLADDERPKSGSSQVAGRWARVCGAARPNVKNQSICGHAKLARTRAKVVLIRRRVCIGAPEKRGRRYLYVQAGQFIWDLSAGPKRGDRSA